MLMYACFWLAVVDTSKAGQGDLDVHVSCNNVRVPCQVQLAPDGSRHNCSFIPASAQQHSVHVTYNKEPVPGKYTWNIVHVPVYNIVLYCIVSIHLYSASCSAHQSEALPVRETQREESMLAAFYIDIRPSKTKSL